MSRTTTVILFLLLVFASVGTASADLPPNYYVTDLGGLDATSNDVAAMGLSPSGAYAAGNILQAVSSRAPPPFQSRRPSFGTTAR